jgi:hypothetical protein
MVPRVEANIPPSWYTFNARYGFAVKTKKTIWKRDALDDLRLHVVLWGEISGIELNVGDVKCSSVKCPDGWQSRVR